MGDSGEELGDGSDNDDESTVEIVVVGDESVESDACVDVLSRCWCECICALWCSSGCGRNNDCFGACAVLLDSLGSGPRPGLSMTVASMS